MREFKYVIKDETGIHARPATNLVKQASAVSSKVTISCNGKSADAKSLLKLMSLGAKKGAEITVTVEGDDEDHAADLLENYLKENL